MQPKTPLTMAVATCLLLSAAPGHGLGFGRVQAPATLGSPLAFTLPVRLEGGERFDADCVQAEVQAGDRRLPPYELRLAVSPGTRDDERLLQLSTLGAVDEPVISVLVTSACSQRVSRRFTVLAQPPAMAPQRPATLAAVEGPGAGAAAHPPKATASTSGRVRSPQAAATPSARAAAAPRTRTAAAHSLRLDAALPLAGTAAAVALGTGLAAPAAGLAAAGLEAGMPAVVAQAATEIAGDQIKALEQQVQEMLVEARRQQDQLGQMRQRLSAAEAANRWLPWLLLGLVATGALALWLALRVRRLQREQARLAWLRPGAGAAPLPTDDDDPLSGQAPLLSPDQPLLSRAADLPGAAPAVATQPSLTVAHPMVAAVAAAAAPAPTPPAPSPSDFSMGTGVPPRPVSVEELLDLDQQADFFMVLGQEQSAIDLLLSHVRSTGGTNALPYFKLLEIYRQQGDEEAYERTRERFNQRFNAFAPDWSGDLAHGRSLEDYPEVVERLQRAWPQPLRAVAELESLLLRRADLEPFDLPAYRDVLMLHALVRDLPASPVPAAANARPATPQAGAVPPPGPFAPLAASAAVVTFATVDLLLPLDGVEDDDDDSPDITLPRPHLSERSSAQAMLADWVFTRSAPSAAAPRAGGLDDDDTDAGVRIDLDLSDFAPAPREFTRPAAFTDIELRRDSRLSDLAAFDDSDLLPPPSRR